MSLHQAEADRRQANMIRYGAIEEADYARARVRVRSGGTLTGWIPWTAARAGSYQDWSPPEVGQQVVIACPDGDPSQGVVLGAIYQDKHPAVGSDGEVTKTDYGDGTSITYDRGGQSLSIVCAGSITITAAGNVTIQGARIDLN